METKKVTLNNGTELELGKKYKQSHWTKAYFDVLSKGNNNYFGIMYFEDGNKQDRLFGILEDSYNWLPYTEPQEEVKWKTFLMVVQHHKSHIPYQVIIRCKSIEDAKIIHKNAISITEVEIEIKEK